MKLLVAEKSERKVRVLEQDFAANDEFDLDESEPWPLPEPRAFGEEDQFNGKEKQ